MIATLQKYRLELLIVITILILAAGLRMYRLPEYMTFLGDEGRDAIVVKKILVDHDYPLLGPVTSVGNMYLGPLYYYMMSVPMALAWLNPVAAAAMVAVIGTAAVALIYYLARTWFGLVPAIMAALLYAISPINIIYSRSSWNPNPAPFFTLLAILGLYRLHRTQNFRWLLLVGVATAFLIQMHYLSLILVPVLGLLWLIELVSLYKHKKAKGSFFTWTAVALIAFAFLMSPLVIFDMKYNYQNYRALTTFFGNRETTVNLNIFNTIGRVFPIYTHSLVGRYMAGGEVFLQYLLSILLLLPVLYTGWLLANKKFVWPLVTLSIWLIVGVMGLALYKQTIYDHYLGFLNPAPYLLFGGLFFILQKLTKNTFKLLASILLGVLFVYLVMVAINTNPFKEPNRQLEKTQKIAQFVINQTDGKPYNFALIAKSNYDAAYQFYLDIYGHKPKVVPFDITDQLIVVCEDPVCEPVTNAKQEISHFGWSKIQDEQSYEGVRIFKLVHNEDQPKAEN